MNLILRRAVWLDGDNRPNDYTVFHDGRKIGRIYRMWRWTQMGIFQPTHGPPMAGWPIASRVRFRRERTRYPQPWMRSPGSPISRLMKSLSAHDPERTLDPLPDCKRR